MTTPLPFEKMYEDANLWTHEVAKQLGHDNRQVGYHALRGVLFALRDRMPLEEVFGLAAQLPTVLRGIYFEGYNPANKPEKYGRDEFLQRVNADLQSVNGENPERATEAVFSVLSAHVGEGEMEHVRNVLPQDLQPLVTA